MVEPFTAGVLLALGVEGLRWLGVTFAAGVVQVGAGNTLGRIARSVETRAKVREIPQSDDGIRVPDRVLRAWLGDTEVKEILDVATGEPDRTDPTIARALVDRMVVLWHDRPAGPTSAERHAADQAVAGLLASLSAERFPNHVLGWLRKVHEQGEVQGHLLEQVLAGIEALDLSTVATKVDLEDSTHEVLVNLETLVALVSFIIERTANHRGEMTARMELILQELRTLRAEVSGDRSHAEGRTGSSSIEHAPTVPDRVRREIEEHFGRELAEQPQPTWSVETLTERGEACLARNSSVLGDLLISAAIALDATRLIAARAGPSEVGHRFVGIWRDEHPGRSDQPLDLYDLFHLAARVRPVGGARDNSSVVRCMVRLLRSLGRPIDDEIYRWAERWGVVQRDLAISIDEVDAATYRLVVGLTHHGGWATKSASVSEHLCIDQSATSAVGWLVHDDEIVGDPIRFRIEQEGGASQAIARICGSVRTSFLPRTIHVMLPVRELLELNPVTIEIPMGRYASAGLAEDHLVMLHSWDRLTDPDVGIRRQMGSGRGDRPSAPRWIRPDDGHLHRAAEHDYCKRLFAEVSKLGPAVGLEQLPTRSTTWSVILAAAPYLIWHRDDRMTPAQREAVGTDWAEFPGCAGSSRQQHRAFDVGELGVVWDSPEFVHLINELGLAGVGSPARFADMEWGGQETWT